MLDEIKKDAGERMAKSVASLKQELTKLRTGRAHTSLLDHITVEYYGKKKKGDLLRDRPLLNVT